MSADILLWKTATVLASASCVLLAYQQIVIFKRIATLASIIETLHEMIRGRKDL